jgi:hypothetical protein
MFRYLSIAMRFFSDTGVSRTGLVSAWQLTPIAARIE